MTMSLRAWLEIIAGLIIIVAVTTWTMHERSVGAQKIEQADARATQKAQAAAKAQTDALIAQAAKAAQEASHAQAVLNAYMAAHPLGPIYLSVRHEDDCRTGLSQASSTPSGTPATSPRPTAIPPVSSGVDAGPGLTILVQAASRLAIENREWQSLTAPKAHN